MTEKEMLAPGQQTMGIRAFNGVEHITIKEKASIIEAVSAMAGQEIEMANKYKITDDNGHDLFYAVEQTNCCYRQLKQCAPDCAPWEVDILYIKDGGNDVAFKMTRPSSCTCCCFNRPLVEVDDADGNKVGSITDPCACFNFTFDVSDENGEHLLKLNGGCCQPGLFCPLPCGPCSKVEFPVQDDDGHEVAMVEKHVPGCCKFFFASDVDNYEVDLSKVDTPQKKALLMAAAIFIDFRYFSNNSADDGGGMDFGGGDE